MIKIKRDLDSTMKEKNNNKNRTSHNHEKNLKQQCIFIEIPIGIVARDILESGLFDELVCHRNLHFVIITPAHNDLFMFRKFSRPNVSFEPLLEVKVGRWHELLRRIRCYKGLNKIPFIVAWLSKIEAKTFRNKAYRPLFRKYQPALVVFPTPRYNEYELAFSYTAAKLNIPILCLLSSWDNLNKGRLLVHFDHVAVWNQQLKELSMTLHGYRPSQISTNGSMQFDPYFNNRNRLQRLEFCNKFALDPEKKIITVATLGVTKWKIDESFIVDTVLKYSEMGVTPYKIQIVLRLHPNDIPFYQEKYAGRKGILLHYCNKQIGQGTMPYSWFMEKEDILNMADLLSNTDVLINTGTTVCVEGAIFDRPTILVGYHPHQQDKVDRYLWNGSYKTHFHSIIEGKLCPVVKTNQELLSWINTYLQHPDTHRTERKEIVKQIAHFTDGKASKRNADLIISLLK